MVATSISPDEDIFEHAKQHGNIYSNYIRDGFIKLAVLFDGEGTITLRYRKSNGKEIFEPRLIIYNTDVDIIEWVSDNFNGTVKPDKRSKKPCYRWTTNNQYEIEQLLDDLLPYFISKRKKKLAELLLEWIALHQKTKATQHISKRKGERFKWEKRECDIHEEMRKLNEK